MTARRNAETAAARAVRGYPVDHGELEAGDTFVWCGHRLRVEAGGSALGMPIRELTLNVTESAGDLKSNVAPQSLISVKNKPVTTAPRCSVCNGKCLWSDDAWVCVKCGAEWYADHAKKFAASEDRDA